MNNLTQGLLAALLSGFVSIPACFAGGDGSSSYEDEIGQWRQARNAGLADPNGWMTLVGLEWLEEGQNSVGAAESSDALIPGGPDSWGTINVDGDTIRFVPAAASATTVDNKAVKEAVLVADNQGQPTVVRNGNISFHVIYRESYALRIKDSKAPALRAFEGVPVYAIKPDWRIEGRFVRAEQGASIGIANVLGQTSDSPVYGYFEFEREGETFSLLALGSEQSQSLWFLFADKTSGRETYGAGRFLYSEGMPEDGKLVVDFNKAYNPPCAFNDYSTCPLPPQQNRMKIAVRAGEKKYHD